MNYIFIDCKEKANLVGIVEDNSLVELYLEEKVVKKTLGNIYRARVDTVVKGMDAAFIDIGQDKNAYLHLNQSLAKDFAKQGEKTTIDKVLKEGQTIIVEITKEASGTKGAKVTTNIELKGRYLVLTPYSKQVYISKKIYKKTDLDRLKNLADEMIKEEIGLVFRTASMNVEKDKIREEYNILLEMYKQIERERNFLPCPKLIYSEPDIGYQIIRDLYNDDIDEIKTNCPDYHRELIIMEENSPFKFSDKLKLERDFSTDLDQRLNREIKNAFKRKIDLESGAYLIIDQLEALTVIDVNTGKFIGKSYREDTLVKTNLEAAEEIARQIRLRDIGGIIVIDFIDMKNKKDQDRLLEQLNKYLEKDRNKAKLVGITKLGLVELTRRKKRKSIKSNYYSICPQCQGVGKIFIDI